MKSSSLKHLLVKGCISELISKNTPRQASENSTKINEKGKIFYIYLN